MGSRERIEAAANPRKGMSHLNLAKDNPEYAAGAVRWQEGGPTLFEMAVSLATRDTVRQWGLIEDELEDEHEEQGKAIATILKTGWASNFPADPKDAAPVTILLEDGELRLSSSLELTVRLTMRPSRWSQGGAREAVALFTRLTGEEPLGDSPEVEGEQPSGPSAYFCVTCARRRFKLISSASWSRREGWCGGTNSTTPTTAASPSWVLPTRRHAAA